MIKKITTRWLKSKGACQEAIDAFEKQDLDDPIEVLEFLVEEGRRKREKLDWAIWLIQKLMSSRQKRLFAIYMTEQTLSHFENKHRRKIYIARKIINIMKKSRKTADDYTVIFRFRQEYIHTIQRILEERNSNTYISQQQKNAQMILTIEYYLACVGTNDEYITNIIETASAIYGKRAKTKMIEYLRYGIELLRKDRDAKQR